MCVYSLQPGHLAEQNDRKEKRSKIKKKSVKNENPKIKGLLPVNIITGSWQNGNGWKK